MSTHNMYVGDEGVIYVRRAYKFNVWDGLLNFSSQKSKDVLSASQ